MKIVVLTPMFSNNGNNKASSDPDSPEQLNRVVEGSRVEGDLVCKSNLRIDGTVKGTVKTESRLVIGESGFVEGEVVCKEGEVEGKVQGSLHASELISLRSSAHIDGDIETKKLAIEEGAVFTGNCRMGGSGAPEESREQAHGGAGSEQPEEREEGAE